jgi:metal-dependent HD superfamily phosphatase/phosphodiesterase
VQKPLSQNVHPRLSVIGGAVPPARLEIRVPARHNPLLLRILERVNTDRELWTLWQCANVNAVDRLGTSDHGWVHAQIVANLGLKLLRLLIEAGVQPGIMQHHGLGRDEAEAVVVLGALLHNLGVAVHPEEHERHSLVLAHLKVRDLLVDVFDSVTRTVLIAETLHVVAAHRREAQPLTQEAGAVKAADVLELTKGRTRAALAAGAARPDRAAAVIEAVEVRKGTARPAVVEVIVAGPNGVRPVEALLRQQLATSGIQDSLELAVRTAGDTPLAAPIA